MIIKVLGSGAGGGFPQWNCNTRLSRMAWDGDEKVSRRTQSSIAVSADNDDWIVVNASPDLRQQIQSTPELQPRRDGLKRNSPIKAVVLTNADIDHIAGLLSLRESQPFKIYATRRVLAVLAANSVFGVLSDKFVERIELPLERPVEIAGTGVLVEAFPVPGKIALYLEDASKGAGFGTELGDTIGLKIKAGGPSPFFYIPGCATVTSDILRRVAHAAGLLFDGTVFNDTELVDLGVIEKTGQRMGHISMAGEGGSVHAFDGSDIKRKIYIHINTTNPVLERGSTEEASVMQAGWEIAFDGMTITA